MQQVCDGLLCPEAGAVPFLAPPRAASSASSATLEDLARQLGSARAVQALLGARAHEHRSAGGGGVAAATAAVTSAVVAPASASAATKPALLCALEARDGTTAQHALLLLALLRGAGVSARCAPWGGTTEFWSASRLRLRDLLLTRSVATRCGQARARATAAAAQGEDARASSPTLHLPASYRDARNESRPLAAATRGQGAPDAGRASGRGAARAAVDGSVRAQRTAVVRENDRARTDSDCWPMGPVGSAYGAAAPLLSGSAWTRRCQGGASWMSRSRPSRRAWLPKAVRLRSVTQGRPKRFEADAPATHRPAASRCAQAAAAHAYIVGFSQNNARDVTARYASQLAVQGPASKRGTPFGVGVSPCPHLWQVSLAARTTSEWWQAALRATCSAGGRRCRPQPRGSTVEQPEGAAGEVSISASVSSSSSSAAPTTAPRRPQQLTQPQQPARHPPSPPRGVEVVIDLEAGAAEAAEAEELHRRAAQQPLPTSLIEYRRHPLFVLER